LKPKRKILKYILTALVVFGIAWYISAYRYQLMLIRGESMLPAYHDLQIVLLQKRNDDYRAGDVIAFYSEGVSSVVVKRIVGLPGDSVRIEAGVLYVNGAVCERYRDVYFSEAGSLAETVTLRADQYIVIGDNIERSRDSRFEEIGIVERENILGKVL